jgi:hypothetical protein
MKTSLTKFSLTALVVILLGSLAAGCIILPADTPQKPDKPPPPPTINSFTASPDTIISGQEVNLSWSVSGAKAVTLQPILHSADSAGSTRVSPAASTAYTLIASNDSGSVTGFVSVTVKPDPATASQRLVGVDPVTGRNQDIGFEWEQLCLSDEYQVQIAKDAAFTLMVFDSGVYAPPSTTAPAMLYLAGGRMEAGHSYFWRARVRRAATGQVILGYWSLPQKFTIGAGYSVNAPVQGVQLLSPVSSCAGYPVTAVPFTWSPYKETTRYRFTMAKDAGLTDIISAAEVATSSYVYQGTLDYNSSYFWQVMAIQPAPSDPSPVFSFTTQAQQLPQTKTTVTEPATPLWAWIAIGIGGFLILAVVALIFTAGRN